MLFFSSEPTKGINSRLLTAFRMKTAIVVGAFLGKFLQSDPFVKKEIADSSPLRVRLKIKFSVWEVSQTFFFNIWEISAENNRRGEETRCDSVARGLVFTGTWCSAPAMLRCTAFSLPAPLWWKKKNLSRRERETANRKRSRGSHDFCHIPETSSHGEAKGKTEKWTETQRGRGRSAQSHDSNVKMEWHRRKRGDKQRRAERQTERGRRERKPSWNLSQQRNVRKKRRRRCTTRTVQKRRRTTWKIQMKISLCVNAD